jgi:hypothetical protein
MFDNANQGGALLDQRSVKPFATTVTLNDVSSQTVSMRITVVDAFGLPLEVLQGDPGLVNGQTTEVDLTLFTQTVPTLDALQVTPGLLILDTGDTQVLNVVAKFSNGYSVDLTGQTVPGLVFEPQAPGIISVDSQGTVTAVGSGIADLNVTLETNGRTRTITVPALVDQPRLTVVPSSVTLPTGGLRYAPVITRSGLPANLADYDYTSSNPTVANVQTGVITSGSTPGTVTITVSDKTNPNIFAQAQVTTVDVTITGVTSTVSTLGMYVSQGENIEVTATLSNGDTMVSAQNSPDLDVRVGQDTATVLDRKLVALETMGFPPTAQTIEIGFDNGTPQPLNMTVREVQLTSANFVLGDLREGDEGFGQMPAGHYGILSVEGTFEDGSSRPLQVGEEYTVVCSNGNVAVTRYPADIGLNSLVDQRLNNSNSTATMSVELRDDIDGELEQSGADMELEVSVVDPTASELRIGFANYPDDHRVILAQSVPYTTLNTPPLRELDLRADFAGSPNYRLAAAELVVWRVQAPKPPVQPPGVHAVTQARIATKVGIQGWTCLGAGLAYSVEGGPRELPCEAEIPIDFKAELTVGTYINNLSPLHSTIPDEVALISGGEVVNGPLQTEVGRSLSLQTAIDFGQGLEVRGLDYPVFESTLDAVGDVWATFDRATETSTFFFKRTSADHPGNFVFRAYDQLLTNLLRVGSSSPAEAEVEVVRRL